jgi:hypothetical protein
MSIVNLHERPLHLGEEGLEQTDEVGLGQLDLISDLELTTTSLEARGMERNL